MISKLLSAGILFYLACIITATAGMILCYKSFVHFVETSNLCKVIITFIKNKVIYGILIDLGVNECSRLPINILRSLSNERIKAEEMDSYSLPWQAVIFYKGSPFCGGTLIAPKWVVTGAHCLPAWMPSSNVEIKLGINDLFRPTIKQQLFKISKM